MQSARYWLTPMVKHAAPCTPYEEQLLKEVEQLEAEVITLRDHVNHLTTQRCETSPVSCAYCFHNAPMLIRFGSRSEILALECQSCLSPHRLPAPGGGW